MDNQKPMTPERLSEIKSLHEGITPGEWHTELESITHDIWAGTLTETTSGVAVVWDEADATFIAAAPKIVNELIKEVERLRAENAELKKNYQHALNSINYGVDPINDL
jgi:hypothetical protein